MKVMMKRFLKASTLGVILLGLVACIGDFYGYSQQQWQAMDPQQQQQAKLKYEALVAQKNKMVRGDKIENAKEDLIERHIGPTGDLERDN